MEITTGDTAPLIADTASAQELSSVARTHAV